MRQKIVALVLAAGCLPLFGGPQESRRTDLLNELLRAFPAESASARDAAAAKILALGPAALSGLCGRLAAPGEADDGLIRFALDALAVHVGRPGAEKERFPYSQALLQGLPRSRHAENSVFILSLIQRVGREEAVRPLAPLLRDPALAGPASRALAAIKAPRAEAVLLEALPEASPEAAAAVVQALGELRSRAAVKPLLRLAAGREPGLRLAALDALAEIGDPAASPVLERVPVLATAREREGAASRLLLFARRLAEGKRGLEAEKICRAFIANYSAPAESGSRAAALSLLVELRGRAALDDLKAAAVSEDREYRTKALRLVEGLDEAWDGAFWAGLLDASSPAVQADVLALLGRKKEASALAAVRRRLKSEEAEVRLAAIEAAAKIGGENVLEDLAPLFAGAAEAEARALKDGFLAFAADKAVPRAASILRASTASTFGQSALLEFLAERQAKDQADAVLALAKSGEAQVRMAAVGALERVVRPQDAAAVVDLIAASAVARETTLLQNAFAAAVAQASDREARAEAVLAALELTEGPKRADLLRTLPKAGGAKALTAVLAEMKSSDPQLQAVAVYALSQWPDESARPELFAVAKSASDRRSRLLALQGIARLVPASNETPGRKLAALEEAMALAVEPGDKAAILSGFAGLRTAESLVAVGRFLDDPAVQPRAAAAVLRLVLPGPGFEGLKGFETARTLKKALPFVESEYDRGEAERYAHGLLLEAGFVPLFNGKDLDGWKGLVADPPKRAKMGPGEIAKAQAEADDEMRTHWRVVDGVLSFDGKGHSLCTAKDYADFEMYVDWKIEPKGDSGIYLRGSPQVQIWDPAQWPEGSGGLYNNQKNPKNPLVQADRPVGEWNTFYIKMTGERVTVALNGVLVADDVVMENYWERDKPVYPSGQIELQAHSTPLAFKNIYLREISAPAAEVHLPPEEQAEGFVRLFNGRDLSGWRGDLKGYVVEDGAIVVSPSSGGNLYTEKEYADFDFKFEFKLTPGANNGIGVRTPPVGDAAYLGMEIQVLDDSAEQYKDLKTYQYHGSVYGVAPAKRGFQKPVGEWNTEEVIVRGRRVTVILNGTTVVDADLDEASKGGTMDGRDHPGLRRDRGHIGFCGHGSRVEFRNLRIKEYR
ncbi:MAG: DUF1080 domain-containing protein [Candidatus Aminicenantes bacterium]|nr:DUF1080 domain-containing protein [Candidatus Aminicenantes bacterium]